MNIDELKKKMKELNYDNHYIQLCTLYAEKLQENHMPIVFDKRHLEKLLGLAESELSELLNRIDMHYTIKYIKKKNGRDRCIAIPDEKLKNIQQWLLHNIFEHIPLTNNATGFRKNKSIINNAQVHISKDLVVNLDLVDFFNNISLEDVNSIFIKLGYTKEVAITIAKICTFNHLLPQGAPTSPYISNIKCINLDKKLDKLAKEINASYTRYADDLTFSGTKEIKKIIDKIILIIKEEGFQCNPDKTRFRYKNMRQIVTGIVVNNGLSVPREKKKFLEKEIFYCNKYGVQGHLRYIHKEQISNYKEYLFGLAYFITMIEPTVGAKYLNQLGEIEWYY